MNGRTRSILLQVAFKGAIELVGSDKSTVDTLSATTANLYEILIGLHDELSINPDEGAKSGRSGAQFGSGREAPSSTTVTPVGETFIYEGVLIEDFRAAKAAPGSTIKHNYPDFKTVNGQPIDGVTGPRGAAWIKDQDGSPNEAVSVLTTAADQKVM